MGPRKPQYSMVLAGQYRHLYSTADSGPDLATARVCFASASLQILRAVFVLLSHSKPGQAGSLDLGQHQSNFLLVRCFRAAGGVAAGATLAKEALLPVAGGWRHVRNGPGRGHGRSSGDYKYNGISGI